LESILLELKENERKKNPENNIISIKVKEFKPISE
tara:strand:+ start:252 stop:356 length:105 start_codon:yes stop_codon:yes gene_type:complete